MSTYLADRLRAVAKEPLPPRLMQAELFAVAAQVQRMEEWLDQTVRIAQAEAIAVAKAKP